MRISIFFLILGLLSLLLSCDSGKEGSPASYSPILTLSDTIILPLDTTTTPSVRMGHDVIYSPDGKIYFTHTPTSKNTIQLYDIEKQILAFEIPYEEEGPDGVKVPNYHIPLTSDSFFVGNHLAASYALINKDGKVLKRYSWQDKQQIDPFIPGFRYKNQLIFILSPDFARLYEKNYTDPRSLQDDSILMSLDIFTKERQKFFTWPKQYCEQNYLHLTKYTHACRGAGDTLVLSLAASDELYLFDLNRLEAGPIDTVMAKSSMVKPISLPKGSAGANAVVDSSYSASAYLNIIYDPYRKLYYRIGYTPPVEDQMLNTVIPGFQLPKRDIVVLTLDSRFNVIGEDRIDGALVFAQNALVTPQGLAFLENHFNQENAPEDAFRFFVFKPEKQKE